MAAIIRLLSDEQSAIDTRHARLASIFAAASVAAGIGLALLSGPLHEQSSRSVLWALAKGGGPLAL